ncbi:hypothetical protein [Paraburkholderia sp. BL21I4N1]|nr:hypothetical protein [Paraburkholderia sp. BL21I4N1]
MHRHNDPVNRPGATAGSQGGRRWGPDRVPGGGVTGSAFFGLDRRD